MKDLLFWSRLDELVAACEVKIDRPQGTPHPRYPSFVYPLDYGYLENTHSPDGSGIDVWVGSLPDKHVTAVICTVDLIKRDSEVELLIGCTPQEAQRILDIHNTGPQSAIWIERPTEKNP
jgi:inorganic pyrophosphatase